MTSAPRSRHRRAASTRPSSHATYLRARPSSERRRPLSTILAALDYSCRPLEPARCSLGSCTAASCRPASRGRPPRPGQGAAAPLRRGRTRTPSEEQPIPLAWADSRRRRGPVTTEPRRRGYIGPRDRARSVRTDPLRQLRSRGREAAAPRPRVPAWLPRGDYPSRPSALVAAELDKRALAAELDKTREFCSSVFSSVTRSRSSYEPDCL